MSQNNRFAALRNNNTAALARAQQMIQRGEYAGAEIVYKAALDQWRSLSAPRSEEGPLISALGKCYEAQHKYEQAYELYLEALNHLTGVSYDDVYSSFLYLNERMGTFTKKTPDESC